MATITRITQEGSSIGFNEPNLHQTDVQTANQEGAFIELQSDESKWIKSLLDFLKLPFHRRHLAQKKLTETLDDIAKSKTPLSLIKEIISGELGQQIFDMLPGDHTSKYAQMRQLICYIMTLPTEVMIDLENLNQLENDLQHNLFAMYQELVQLREQETSFSFPGTESDNSFKWIDGKDEVNNVVSFYKKAPDGRHLLFFHHFGDKVIEGYEVKFPYHTYFPIGKHVQSVEQIYHTDQAACESLEKKNQEIRILSALSGACVGFSLDISPFSTIILCLNIDEEKLMNPNILPPPPLPCSDVLEITANLSLEIANTGSFLEIPEKVETQIFSAATAHLKIDDTFTIHYGDAYNITDLNPQELACLYYILNSYLQNKIAATAPEHRETTPQIKIFRTITFDILDYCLRIADSDKSKGELILEQLKKYNDPKLAKAIATLETVVNPNFSSVFHKLVNRDAGSDLTSFKTAAIAMHVPGQKKSENPRKLKIWKISLENANNQVGGLGAVMKASGAAHRTMDLDIVLSIHPLYSHEKNPLGQAREKLKFKGVIRHEYNGEMVTSTIYKDPVTKEYLIQPDPRYKSMFDIYESKNVYGGFHFSSRLNRYLYVASVAAAAAATYSGKNGLKSVDVLQADAWHAGSAAMELLSQYLNPMRLEQGLKPIEMVYLTHMLMADLFEQGLVSSSELKKIGIDVDTFPYKTNLTKRALINSSANIFVSHGVARDAIDQDLDLNKGLRASTIAGNPKKVKGITNGISSADFDVTSSKGSGKYAVKDSEFISMQNRVKADLYHEGIIADPTKTLAVFIGRYSDEKGIKMLPEVVKTIKDCDGQIVIMGLLCDDAHSTQIAKELKELSKTEEYRNCLRVYIERDDQMKPFILNGENQNLRKGWAIRQASSFAIVPSFAEACGLVPLEMQCAGALTIAPYHQGLRDMCLPIEAPELSVLDGKPYTFGNGGNAFCYSDCRSVKQIQQTIQMAFSKYSELTSEAKNNLMKRIHGHAIAHHDWVVMKDGVPVTGSAYEYSKTYHELFHAHGQVQEVETFEQALIRRRRTVAALTN